MTEAGCAAPQTNYAPTPLKDFQFTHCRRCPEHCKPEDPKVLACIAAATLNAKVWRYKVYNERGW